MAMNNSLINSSSTTKKVTNKPSTKLGRSSKMPVKILTEKGSREMASRRLIVATREAVEAIKAKEAAEVARMVVADRTKGCSKRVAVASINAMMSLANVTTGLRHRVEVAGNIREETHQLRPRTGIWIMITGNSEATLAASSVEASRTIAEEMASKTKMLTTGA